MRRNNTLVSTVLVTLLALLVGVQAAPFSSSVVVYPSPSTGNVIACDGDIGTNGNPSYLSAQSVADCVNCSSEGIITTETSVGKAGSGVETYSVIRTVLNFDTSFLGVNAQVLSATVSVKATNVHFDFSVADFIRLTPNSLSSQNTYSTSDYGLIGTTALAADYPVSSILSEQYVDFPLNPAGLTAINKTGVSRFGLRTGLDVNSQQPVCGTDETFQDRGGTVVFFHSADTPGTDSDPKLTVVYVSGSQFTASIGASPTGGTVPLTVNLSINANQAVTGVTWKLNGVQFSQQPTTSLVFTVAGNYRIDAVVSSGNVTVNVTTFITASSCTCG